jgi:hypothetical protein
MGALLDGRAGARRLEIVRVAVLSVALAVLGVRA